MPINSFKIPDEILRRYPDWHARVSEQCPHLLAAVEYAIRCGIDIDFVEELDLINSTSKQKMWGCAFLPERRITILCNNATPIHEFNVALGHEIKHISQYDKHPEIFGLDLLMSDIDKTLKTGEYHLRRIYRVLTIPNYGVLTFGLEADTSAYGAKISEESKNAFPEGAAFDSDSEDNDLGPDAFMHPYLVNVIENVESVLSNLQIIKETHHVSPTIEWIAVDAAKIQDCTTGLWGECADTDGSVRPNSYLSVLLLCAEDQFPELGELHERARDILPAVSAKIFSQSHALG